MVGSPHRTLIEHGTGSTGVTFKDRMKRTTGAVIGAEHAMVDRCMTHGALGHMSLRVKCKPISPDYLVGEPGTIHRGDELNVLFLYLQRGRDRRVPAVGKECLGFASGGIQPFDHRESLADIGSGSTVNFIVGDDLSLVVIARLGDVEPHEASGS
jgi:hypothetical protein